MAFGDPLTLLAIAIGVVIVCATGFFTWTRRKRNKQVANPAENDFQSEPKAYPFKVVKTVPREDASQAKDELRLMGLEREILSDAIRRLYEASAEGKITEQERDRLSQTYKARMMTVKEAMSKDESVVALHELETMQEDLMRLFSERFDDLSTKIEELRSKTDVHPIKEITLTPKQVEEEEEDTGKSVSEEKTKRKKRQQQPAKATQRTEAERRIDEIRSEVEKVLDRLGQMEIDS